MDRNQATGLILFAAVILIYSIFFASGPETPVVDENQAQTEQESISSAIDGSSAVVETPIELVDSLRASKFGVLAPLTVGEAKVVVLENEQVKITFSTKGAAIKEVQLKEYESWKGEPLLLLSEESSNLSESITTRFGEFNLTDFYFTPSLNSTPGEEGTIHELTFTAQTESGAIKQTFTLNDGEYVVKKSFEIENYQGVFTGNEVKLSWTDQVKAQEKDLAESRRKSQVNYYLTSGTYENLGVSDDTEEAAVTEPVKWIGFSQRFFTAGIIAENDFKNVNLTQSTPADSSIVRTMGASFSVPVENGKSAYSFYFGPDKYKTLKKVTEGFEKNVDMGYFFVSWVNKYIVVHLFEFLEKYFSNYGIIIIIIVFLIKLALSPLTYKSYIGMAKMRVIKPEIDELKEKFGDDPTKMQQEQMKLFSQLGVSPISGCLPLLLQMPFLFAMFFFFPNSIELRQESFLWAKDLSTYDEFFKLPFTIPFYGSHVSLFTLLMTVSQIIYTHFNNQLTTATGPMKNLGYIMPVMFMFILNSYPAGLSFYYFVSNVFTFGQQALIKLFVDDTKIRQKVEENKAKNVNKKKSKFQQRLEDAMKAADANKKK
ncbi:YidC/Oxa1 family membrane protein insertase [Algoriphagus boseongensis]|uniref:Membrane protein insertase YidC n=1 Tax=Algoriphagus boseongensis TaxID=1442587 RepID=A0A4R6T0S5_9BACT|nr:membrane protein insertase YidC [Algoriphagus boseongensis]TDQ13559.1 YidC/Oxa1 family membrane protein insertase [Algoriphagus boseongensis]